MLLVLASVVFLGSESLGTRDRILLSQFWHFLLVASYDSQGHGGGIRRHLHTGRRPVWSWPSLYSLGTDPTGNTALNSSIVAWLSYRPGQRRKHHFTQLLHCCVCVCCSLHVTATEPLPSNGRVYRAVPLQWLSPLASQFSLSADMPQYSERSNCSNLLFTSDINYRQCILSMNIEAMGFNTRLEMYVLQNVCTYNVKINSCELHLRNSALPCCITSRNPQSVTVSVADSVTRPLSFRRLRRSISCSVPRNF
jgi:hypothetical protein